MRFNRFLLSALLCLSCGKKASSPQNHDKANKDLVTVPERLFSAEKELQRSVEANDTIALRRVIFENPDLNLNRTLNDGDTLLTFSIKKNFPLIRNILLEKGANPDLVSQNVDFSGQTPLMIAASLGDNSSIRALIDASAALNNQDWHGDTALHKAIRNTKDDAARALIYAGADLQIQNDDHESPLKIAQRLERRDIADYILGLVNLELGAPTTEIFRRILRDADIVNYRKLVSLHPEAIREFESINPLVLAIEAQNDLNSFEIAQSLLALKLSPDGPVLAEASPLNRAVALKKMNFTELLLRYKADVNLVDNSGHPPLYYAIDNNDEEMVELLVNNEAKEKFSGFKGCKVADAVKKRLKTAEERFINQKIQSRLDCFWTR